MGSWSEFGCSATQTRKGNKMVLCKDCKFCKLDKTPSLSECTANPAMNSVTGEFLRNGDCYIWNPSLSCKKFEEKTNGDQ